MHANTCGGEGDGDGGGGGEGGALQSSWQSLTVVYFCASHAAAILGSSSLNRRRSSFSHATQFCS